MRVKMAAKHISMDEVILLNTGLTMIQISGLGGSVVLYGSFRLPLSTNPGIPICVQNRIFSNIRNDMGANHTFVHLQCTDYDNFSVFTLTKTRFIPSTCTSKIQPSVAVCRMARFKTVENSNTKCLSFRCRSS